MSNDTPAANKKDISYSPSFMSQIAMFPLKNPGDVRFVERTNGCMSVAVMQSMWGWTYGKIPRLFLIYVRSLVQTKSDKVDMENRIVKLDKSFRSFCEEAGLCTGTNIKDVEQSLLCLSGTTFTISLIGKSPNGRHFMEGRNLRLVSQFHLRFNNSKFDYPGFKDDGDPSSYIQFSEEMWSMFTDNPVPLNKRITFELGKSARAVTFSPACGGGGFLFKNPNGFSVYRLSPHALWFVRFMSRATQWFSLPHPECFGRRSRHGHATLRMMGTPIRGCSNP